MLNLTPSDTELVALAYERVDALSDPLKSIGDTAAALALAAHGLPSPAAGAIGRLAASIVADLDAVNEQRAMLLDALHPQRRFTGLDDGNGEVEPAAGDAA